MRTGFWITRALVGAVGAALACATPAAAQAPVASWRLDDGSGTAARDSRPLRLDGSLTPGPGWIAGVEGAALRFGGTGAVVLPDSSALEPQAITVGAWVRRVGSPGTFRYVFSKGSSTCLRSSYALYTGSSGGMAFYVGGNGLFTLSPQAAASSVWDGRWHRVVGTYDRARVRLFVDGAQVGGGTAGPTNIEYGLASRAPYIGAYGGCNLPFNGDIDDVDVWSSALSANGVEADAVPPPETPATGPIGHAPGAPPVRVAEKGRTTTPTRCTSVAVSRRAVPIHRRTAIVATVRKGTKRARGVRVVLKARHIHKHGRTNKRGRARFVVRAVRRNRLTVKAAAPTRSGCSRPVAYVRVRR
jgi:hypothetical protein